MGRTAKVEDAVVEQAAVEDAVVKQDAEPQKKGEKLIRFKIPLGSADKDRADVFVAVNGKWSTNRTSGICCRGSGKCRSSA